jgi:hypothetical protein
VTDSKITLPSTMVSLAAPNRVSDVAAPIVGGGSLKRKNPDNSSDVETPAPSQLKRRRVAFNPDVHVRILSNDDEKSLELVHEEVRRAIEKHATGEKAAYDLLKGLFREDPKSSNAPLTSLLQKYVIALANQVHLLDYSCKGLVHAVIDCSWVARNDSFVHIAPSCIHCSRSSLGSCRRCCKYSSPCSSSHHPPTQGDQTIPLSNGYAWTRGYTSACGQYCGTIQWPTRI